MFLTSRMLDSSSELASNHAAKPSFFTASMTSFVRTVFPDPEAPVTEFKS